MKKSITLLFFFFLMAQSMLAGNPGTGMMFVTGHVTDQSSNETLAGVEVRVKGTTIVTYTDFDGNFYLPELPAGTYTLEFKYITYTATTAVTDGSELEPELNVALLQQ